LDSEKTIVINTRTFGNNTAVAVVGALVIPFLSQVPILSFTIYGNACRQLGILLIISLCCLKQKTIIKNLTKGEILFIWYLLSIECIGAISGAYFNIYPNIFMVFRFLILNLFCYLIARSFASIEILEKAFNLFYKVNLIAAMTGIVALVSEYYDCRRMHEILIETDSDSPYYLMWFGLLGGDVGEAGNGRTNFIFSESSHFAHFLIPGIAYAMATKRRIGLVILLSGFLTTFSVSASIAVAGMICFILLKSKRKIVYLIFLGLSCFVVVPLFNKHINKSEDYREWLFDRKVSAESKFDTLEASIKNLYEKPFGFGIVQTDKKFDSSINTSPGFFSWIFWFGWLGICALAIIFLFLGLKLMQYKNDMIYLSISACTFTLFLGTLSHGPTPKYYMCYLLGMLVRLNQLKLQQDITTQKI
jgi:hypothetical protein